MSTEQSHGQQDYGQEKGENFVSSVAQKIRRILSLTSLSSFFTLDFNYGRFAAWKMKCIHTRVCTALLPQAGAGEDSSLCLPNASSHEGCSVICSLCSPFPQNRHTQWQTCSVLPALNFSAFKDSAVCSGGFLGQHQLLYIHQSKKKKRRKKNQTYLIVFGERFPNDLWERSSTVNPMFLCMKDFSLWR